MESVEGPLEEVRRRASDERLLRASRMGPHQEDEGFFHGSLVELTLVVDKGGVCERGGTLPLRNEVGEALPNKDGQVVSQAIRRYRLGGLEPLSVLGHFLTIDCYVTSVLKRVPIPPREVGVSRIFQARSRELFDYDLRIITA